MQKFSEFVNDYKKYRESNGMDSNVSPEQVKRIRELYESLNSKKTKVKESEEVDLNSNGEAKPEVEQAQPEVEEPKDAKLTESSEKEEEGKDEAEKETESCDCGKPDCDGKDCKEGEKVEESTEEAFEKALAEYRERKFKEKGTRGVTMQEKEEIRAKLNQKEPLNESAEAKTEIKETKEGETMEDVKFEESIEGFKAVVEQYRNWKKNHYKTSKLTESEKETLKAKFLEKVSKLNESKEEEPKEENKRFTEALDQYKAWKLSKYNTDEVTKFEEAQIAKGLVLDDIKAKLDEAKKLVESGKKHLTEGDVMDAGADAQAAAGAVNDATAMGADPAMAGDPNAVADPNAGAALPQNIVDEISQIKTSIDALATECGIESPVDLGADAGAGVPAVTGAADPNADATAVADPNAAAAPAPLPESIKSVKARIAARNAQLKETIKYSNTKMVDGAKDDMVKIPTEAELANGTKSISANVKKATWPIEKADIKDATKVKNIEECTQEELAKMTLNEDNQFDWKKYTSMLKNL